MKDEEGMKMWKQETSLQYILKGRVDLRIAGINPI